MQKEMEVFIGNNQSITKGDYQFSVPNSEGGEYWKKAGYTSLGTTVIDIKEPKKKKLVYHWLFEKVSGEFGLTVPRFGTNINDKEIAKRYIEDYWTLKEGGILRPLMESEKEIDV
jgi:hypothetical protein